MNPAVRCMALVEVGQAEPAQVREYVRPVMEHADAVCYSMEEFSEVVRRWCGVGG